METSRWKTISLSSRCRFALPDKIRPNGADGINFIPSGLAVVFPKGRVPRSH